MDSHLKKKVFFFLTILLIILGLCPSLQAHPDHLTVTRQDFSEKKVLIVNSYHKGYEWSDTIGHVARSILEPSGVEVHEFFMDTKRNEDKASIQRAALQAKREIEYWKPDLVIVSDDNASKYLVMPYYKDSELPFVFCGVNGDSSIYGYPYSNATGIEEVPLIKPLPGELKRFARGDRLGILSGSVVSDRRNVQYYKKMLDSSFEHEVYVTTFEEWKERFIELQSDVDILLLVYSQSISNWVDEEAQSFVLGNIRIPVGATETRLLPYSLIVYAHVAEEQGSYAAATALRILNGEKPGDIPVKHNNQAKVLVNLEIADKLDVVIPFSLLKKAEIYHRGPTQ